MGGDGSSHNLNQWFLTWVRLNPWGSVSQFQGFGDKEILSNNSKTNKINDIHYTFVTTKGSVNLFMELVGFSTSNKVRNH